MVGSSLRSSGARFFSSANLEDLNPVDRVAKIFKDDAVELKEKLLGKRTWSEKKKIFPSHCDVLIVGGGVMGYSTAYWLADRCQGNLRIVLIEKDPTYQKCTSVLSVGGLRQQFSLRENIELSLASADFMRNIKRNLSVDESDPPDISFNPCGYLFLASEKGAHVLQENHALQTSLGAVVELLSPAKLKEKFPFINTDGIELGCHGLENEGWFDPWSLLNAFRRKAIALGVECINGTLKGFGYKAHSQINHLMLPPGQYQHAEKAIIELEDGSERSINFAKLVVAAGCNTGEIGAMLNLGQGQQGILGAPIPIEPRKRFVYVVHCPDAPGLAMPFIIDPSGAYVRREGFGGNYVCGKSPSPEDPEPTCDNMDVDYEFFENEVWPLIAHRVPAFENAKVKNAWAGFYDFNRFDENAFIGLHPAFHNIYVVAGFSGHGIQQSPAVGRAMMELIIDGEFVTIDLKRFGFQRYYDDEPLYESNIV
ncbi:unnamed protein product [Nesidiocoris tenuis]|uniref:FAD-dependent oxidoreductase domain-containing protein 1 n=1 Tax=Nesidiocoris tenuis TaxID=355587 RepID=A0A6H5GKM3_9HEMI|nr:unnamed protein product [Nesidiocoris tenuis]